MNGGAPVVTIVVTGADDATAGAATARTVASAHKQSLRAVEVLVTDAAAGVEQAAADYIMIVPSGVELDVHAARALVAAATETGAELVAGRWERPGGQHATGVLEMFRHTAHYASLDERPELSDDHAVANKLLATALLRRGGLRVGEASDAAQLVALAYARAGGIAVIPQRVCVDRRSAAEPDAVACRVDQLQIRGTVLRLRGQLLGDPAGRADPLALVVAPAGTDREVELPVTVVEQTPQGLAWESAIDLPAVLRQATHEDRTWGLRLAVSAADERILLPLSAHDGAELDAKRLMSTRRRLPVGDVLQSHVNARGNLVLRLAPKGRIARQAQRGRRAAVAYLGSAETKARVYRHALVRLPLKSKSVVFESHMGQALSDNPRYVFEELHRRNAGFECVWSFAGAVPELPPGVRSVRRNSWAFYLALARAKYWVDNQGFPAVITKPARTTYLQTWHGSAHKHMGEDTPAFRRMSAQQQARHRAMVARWDYFVARTEHDVRALVPALHVQAQILRTGYPRNDPVVQMHSPEQRAAVRAELGLPDDRVLVLYAPTFRETHAGGRQPFELRIDLDQMLDKLPSHLLLVRTHYLQRLRRSVATHPSARDVSSVPDITPLLVAADVLVTDYSSVMFDFANTGRPMVFFAYDYDDYANSERGVYFDLKDKAPGPMVRTGDELIQALATADTWGPDYVQRYRAFVADYGEYDTGTAAQQVVDRVFFGSSRDE